MHLTHIRPEGIVYRIVGFEVDPRSVAVANVEVLPEQRCAISADANVLELKKNSECTKTAVQTR